MSRIVRFPNPLALGSPKAKKQKQVRGGTRLCLDRRPNNDIKNINPNISYYSDQVLQNLLFLSNSNQLLSRHQIVKTEAAPKWTSDCKSSPCRKTILLEPRIFGQVRGAESQLQRSESKVETARAEPASSRQVFQAVQRQSQQEVQPNERPPQLLRRPARRPSFLRLLLSRFLPAFQMHTIQRRAKLMKSGK